MINQDKDLVYTRKEFLSPAALTSAIFSCIKGQNKEYEPIVRRYFEYKHFKDNIVPKLIDLNPECEAAEEYFNRKKDILSVKAAAGQGTNHPDVRQFHCEKRGNTRARKDQMNTEEVRKAKREAGIILCPVRCPVTLHYCRCAYLKNSGLREHIEKEKKHNFPVGISTKSRAVLMASKPGGLLATGSRSNRKSKGFKTFPEAADGSPGEAAADCFQAFNRIENRDTIRKTQQQIEFLDDIFHNSEQKLTGAQTAEKMSKVIDESDGGLKFCYSKRGTYMPQTGKHKAAYAAWGGCLLCSEKPCVCNGDVLPPNVIASYFAKLYSKQKKRGNLTTKQAAQEETHEALVALAEEQTKALVAEMNTD